MHREILYLFIVYFICSIPFNTLLTLWTTGINLSQVGTKNAGIANAFRHAPLWVGCLCVLVEIIKVIGTIWIGALIINPHRIYLYMILLVNIIANLFPVFLKFKGSKARTVSGWGLLYLSPFLAVFIFGWWALSFYILKNSRKAVNRTLPIVPIAIYFGERSWVITALSLVVTLLFYLLNSPERDDFSKLGAGVRQ